MARQYVFICDGCDARVSSRNADRPSYWADVNISIAGYTNWQSGGSKEQHADRLLCGTCQIVLRDRADPQKWVRPSEESEDQADV